jgi:uncharacterized protein
MIKREMETSLKDLARSYPIVTIFGPRQSGKTTLVQNCFPEKPYVNLEEPDTRLLAEQDPRSFFRQFPDGAIIDEIQRVPSLLSYLQAHVDKDKRKGLFILTGSHQLLLKQEISQSLAGRTAILHLLPLTLAELHSVFTPLDLNQQLLNGFYPRIFVDHLNPSIAYRSYLETYVERDLAQIINIKDLSNFQRFMKLCAGRIGSLLNKNSLSGDLGVSSSTIESWLSVLEASHIIMRIQPYYENFGKRIIKSQKLYFTDPGFAAYLLGIETVNQMDRDPIRPYLFENLVLLEMVKSRYNVGYDHQISFYRDQHQHEVDFIFQSGHTLIPIEVKSGETINLDFFKGLNYFSALVGERFSGGYLIYSGAKMQSVNNFAVLNYQEARMCVETN